VLLVLVIGGVGWLYGGLVGAVVFKLMQDALASITPQYWQFWIGLVLVALVLVGRERVAALGGRLLRRGGRRTGSAAPVPEAAE
jgi:branched-chain amino acid transport system permease protein